LREVPALWEEFLVVVLAVVVRAFFDVLVDGGGAYVKESLLVRSGVPGEFLSWGAGPWTERFPQPCVGHAVEELSEAGSLECPSAFSGFRLQWPFI
jgi:hypothetical protein